MAKFKSYKSFLIHLGIIITLFILIVLGFFKVYLPSATNHGDSKKIPDIKGMKLSELKEFLDERKFNYQINDSAYSHKHEPGVIISQYPKEGSSVKGDRTIYIEISSRNPPMVKMPDLTSSSITNARMELKSYGLKLDTIKKVHHPDKNSVLRQIHNDTIIRAGTKLRKGSKILLVVGSGLGSKKVNVPDLWGVNIPTARAILDSKGLILGVTVEMPDSDQPPGTIVKQKPEYEPGRKVNLGSEIDVWVSGSEEEW